MLSIHIIGFVSWFAGLFYLPRLFVYHAMAEDKGQKVLSNQFKIMEQKLFGVMENLRQFFSDGTLENEIDLESHA